MKEKIQQAVICIVFSSLEQTHQNLIITKQEAEGITGDADGYVLDSLSKLEQDLIKLLTVVRNGISEVHTAPPSKSATQAQQQVAAPQMRQSVEVPARPPANPEEQGM